MGAIRILAAAAVLAVATVSAAPCFAEEASGYRLASLGTTDGYGSYPLEATPADAGESEAVPVVKPARESGWCLLMQADSAAKRVSSSIGTPTCGGPLALRPSPAYSLDRRVPAAQVNDAEGLSLIGMAGVVGEFRHAFSRRSGLHSDDAGVARVMRTLRDSVFAKRISILSESGRISENNPYLVGVSFTH